MERFNNRIERKRERERERGKWRRRG